MWFRALIPTLLALLVLVGIFLRSINFPKPLRGIWRRATSPFAQYLSLEDLAEAYGTYVRIEPPTWKTRALTVLSSLQAIGWLGYTVFAFSAQLDDEEVWTAAVAAGIWVCIIKVTVNNKADRLLLGFMCA